MHSSLSKKKIRKHRKTIRNSRGSGKYTHKRKREVKGEGKVLVDSFSNGLTLIYEPSLNPSLDLTCICLFVNLGSAQEPEELRGVSHLIEHMMFKATEKRSEDSLLKIFDSTGAKFNAYTSKRLTCFYIICETKHMKECLDALSEMVIHAIFDKKELEKEQKVVHEENVQDEDDPDNLLQDGVDMAIFDGSYYSTPIDYIHSPLERKKVIEYYRKYYLPENMALSIVSSASYGAVKKMIVQNPFSHFHSFHPSAEREKENPSEKEERIGVNTDLLNINKYHPYVNYDRYKKNNGMEIIYGKIKGYNTVQIAIGFRTCAWKEIHDREILKLIKTIFARGLNGRLYNELREKHGLAYSPSAGTEYYDTMGKITLYTEIESKKLIEFREDGKRKRGVLPILFDLLQDFIDKGPTAKEWEDVKGYYHGEQIIAMQKINHFAEYNGKNYWLSLDGGSEKKGDIESYQNHWEKYIQPITLEECRECIAKYFTPSSMCIVLVGSSLPSIRVLEKCVDSYF
jgi:predicted Zn-dependent peptidase